ncbi:hypothetical protein [Martelella mangrovi]|uniref:Uncharacterized protein n=1 Tax=Martelella mangrovi TaxID=1397477 RepID=A0ABV2IDQ0_9HYPH
MSWIVIGLLALVFVFFTVSGGIGLLIGRANGNDTRGRGRKR